MLSLERCREILKKDCPSTDSSIESLRDQLYGLADIVIEHYKARPTKRVQIALERELGEVLALPPSAREKWEERAAIMEFDGGLPRSEAENAAFDLLREVKDEPQ